MLMIDAQIFQELCELLPREQWTSITQELFDSETGDVHKLASMIAAGGARQDIGNQAHKLKGASLLLGMKDLGQWAAHIEHLARRTEEPVTSDLVDTLLSLAEATQVEVQQRLAE